MKRRFSKISNRRTACQEKVGKSHSYIAEIQNEVIRKHSETKMTRCRTRVTTRRLTSEWFYNSNVSVTTYSVTSPSHDFLRNKNLLRIFNSS